jgi:hypothetical protein
MDGSHAPQYTLLFDVFNRIYSPSDNVKWTKYMNGFTDKNRTVYSYIYDDNIRIEHVTKDSVLDDYIFNDKEYKNDEKILLRKIIMRVKKMKDDGTLSMSIFRSYKDYVERLKEKIKKKKVE